MNRCDLLITKDENQRNLNLIGCCGLMTFIFYLIFLIKTNKQELIEWMDFLYLDKSLEHYSVRHNFSIKSTKFLYFVYDFFVHFTRATSLFYLLIVFIFCLQSLFLNIGKNDDLFILIFCYLPTLISIMICMTWFYSTVSKNISIFILFNIFEANKLEQFSEELIDYKQRDRNKFMVKHLNHLRIFLRNFKNSQTFFNYSTQTFLGPLFLTMIYYPYALLISKDSIKNFLIISYSLNIILILQVFSIASFFRVKVSESSNLNRSITK